MTFMMVSMVPESMPGESTKMYWDNRNYNVSPRLDMHLIWFLDGSPESRGGCSRDICLRCRDRWGGETW